jgi:integrase/recombinase XerD
MLDAGVDLRDVQIARQNLDRHPNYILAAYMASGT